MWVAKIAKLILAVVQNARVGLGRSSRASCSTLELERQVQSVDPDPGNRMAFGCLPTQDQSCFFYPPFIQLNSPDTPLLGLNSVTSLLVHRCYPTIDDC